MAKRLIDKDELLELAQTAELSYTFGNAYGDECFEYVESSDIEDAEEIDAVEVCHCFDCIHYKEKCGAIPIEKLTEAIRIMPMTYEDKPMDVLNRVQDIIGHLSEGCGTKRFCKLHNVETDRLNYCAWAEEK